VGGTWQAPDESDVVEAMVEMEVATVAVVVATSSLEVVVVATSSVEVVVEAELSRSARRCAQGARSAQDL
jgi:hypothetical protein